MNFTRQVTKTLIVRVKKGVRQLVLLPQGMRVLRWKGQRMTLVKAWMMLSPPVQFVVGPNGLREFIMLPIWMVNDFTSTIKESHFKTLRESTKSPSTYP